MSPLDPSPIFLIGFMATGKSTVGRLVAERTGRRFVDLDAEIEREAGKSVADIFRTEGEAAFRRAEARALADLARARDVVVACGGGTPCFGDNLARMRGGGVVVALHASIDEILRRVGDPSSRPLLAAPADRRKAAERLYREREAVYRAADVRVDTDGREAGEVAEECAARARARLGAAAVLLGERTYGVHLDALDAAGTLARELIGCASAGLVTDENVARAGHAAAVRRALEAAGVRVVEVVVPAGEASKRLAVVEQVASELVAGGLDRRSAVLAVGVGVVGDLAGLVAALLYRGVACAQVPTTLLAMVDAAIGGKTAVDLPAGKNLVGAFWQPRFVLADVRTLDTLAPRELGAAFGEVLKYGLIGDAGLFAQIEAHGRDLDVAQVVVRCARLKARVVAGDEHEAGAQGRVVLNLGHTVGHAIETASGYAEAGGLLHGEAVALGLVAAARISARLGLCPEALEARVADAVRRAGLPADLEPWLRRPVPPALSVDKKRAGGDIRFVALEDVGRPVVVDLSPAELAGVLRWHEG